MLKYSEIINRISEILKKDIFFIGGVAKSGTTWVQHILNGHPGTYHEVRFEDLKTKPIETIEKLLQFLEVDYSKGPIDLCLSNGSFKKLSGGRAPRQEDRDSHFRKGISGDWKNHFDKNCLDIFMRHGAALLQELGYR